jgi:hypothetical protein
VKLRFLRNKKSLSLFESLLAVAILSITAIASLQAISFSARLSGLSQDLVKAVFISEDKLQELEFKEKMGFLNNEPASFQGKDDKFSWKYNLNFDQELKLYRLDFSVFWNRLKRQESLDISTYLK